MTEKELDLYARWESERMRLMTQSDNTYKSGNNTLARRYQDRANIYYECMKDLAASANDYEVAPIGKKRHSA